MTFEFHPVNIENWSDFETLIESKGSPHSCWCTAWIDVAKKSKKAEKSEKKSAIKNRVESGIPIGLLAYSNSEPIGWCAVAPRDTYKNLGGDETKEQVWSVVCFFIKRSFRGQGLTNLLLNEAVAYARNHGAKYIEGYPVAPESPSYRFMGFKPTFEKANFRFIKNAGTRRNVMLREL
ncbi:MAG: GNAT family N-acetyltransferase [SAR86 cluster bacterium]|uniref:GNAT family N-acetyltransferase n=1 Tax=SAR86 cluster bacterium TaxID=2030880 RepID=A0A2A5CJ94_9GAMM|nr:GNAT family N-acetyltransferase [Gammaproteobacteria bacterium AH-315-E17]PCJ43500.1 MAG: GNAT family N-acetyltransferase [SAR86 cluster bacterium]